jgi:hypothetical protein
LLPAEALLLLDESEFSALRRSTLVARGERRRGGNFMLFQCAICKQPVYLARYKIESRNRWFVHDGRSENCPWYEGNRLTPDQTKALIYRGQQEGARHQEIKKFLAHWLEADPLVQGTCLEKTTFSEVMRGEWRRPDVKCQYQGKSLVFEIQLSYTFLSDVIARDEFYRREGIFIIWVFAAFDLNRAVVIDEAFFNRRNLFVLDADAISQTIKRGALTFSGFRQVPQLVNEVIVDGWTSGFVELKDISYPSDTLRPYFYDYEFERKVIEASRIEALQVGQMALWADEVQAYIDAALRYYASDYADNLKAELLEHLDKGKHAGNRLLLVGVDALNDSGFYGWHGVLPVLLSIKLGKPIGYSSTLSIFQVIEAGLRTGHRYVGKHAYAILFLWAYKEYRPTVTEKNHKWLREYARKIKDSVDAGEDTYRRFPGYDKAIILLFPEMAKHLENTFGLMGSQD